ncbi:MAG: hypothetical protein R3Y38_01285 [Rikenellaceae bacterium]
MKRIYIILSLILVCSLTSALAQDKFADQRVEVIKNYSPEIDKAAKLTPMPNMVDTVKLKPESDYQIFPSPWQTSFGVEPYKAVVVNSGGKEPSAPYYIKIGGGAPYNSIFDFYTNQDWNSGHAIAKVNHLGYWGKIDKKGALETENEVELAVNQKVGFNKEFNASLGYSYDYYTKYGIYDTVSTAKIETADYSNINLKLYFGDDFTNDTKFNFGLSAGGNMMFQGNILQQDFFGKFISSFGFGKHTVGFDAGVYGAFINQIKYQNASASLSPKYGFKHKNLSINSALEFTYDRLSGYKDKLYFLPDVNVNYELSRDYLSLFLDLNSTLERGDFYSLVKQNPYILSGLTTINDASYNITAGISGSFAKSYSYSTHLGYCYMPDMIMFANDYNNQGSFTLLHDKVSRYEVGANIQGYITRGLIMGLGADYYMYDTKLYSKAGSKENYKVNYMINYSLKEKFFIRASADVIGRRYFYEYDSLGELNTSRKSTCVNVSMGIDYRISELLKIYIEGENLACAELYPYNHYKGYGINGRIGAKFIF